MIVAYSFTEDVKLALATAREEGSRLGCDYVGTEHLALGVLRTEGGDSARLLQSVDRRALIAELERRSARAESSGASSMDLPYTSRAMRALELAMREASELGHDVMGTDHLLLGLLREESGISAQVLRAGGLDLEHARAAALLARRGATEGTHRARPRRVLLRVLEWVGVLPRGRF